MLGRAGVLLLVAGLIPSVGPTPTAAAARAECGPAQEKTVPLTSAPWALQRLNPAAVWSMTRGAGVTVAVIDSGVSTDPPVLKDKLDSRSKDFAGGGDAYCDKVGHGTMVAAVIAGRDGIGPFTGIAPDAAILSLRAVPDQDNQLLNDNLVNAIKDAIAKKVQVINISVTTTPDDHLQAAIKDAIDHDIVVVSASGNEAAGREAGPSYPAAYDGVLAVAGVDEAGQRVATSRAGDYVDVAAPGSNLIGPATQGENFVSWDGTSFAAAYVSGVVALLRSYAPKLSAAEVINRITQTADRPADGHDENVGNGVVNPYRAITTISSTRADLPVASLPPPHAAVDPLATRRHITIWITVAAMVIAGALLFGGPVLRAGRRRRWRAGQSL